MVKIVDLIARIDALEAKLTNIDKRFVRLEAELQRRIEMSAPLGFWAKLKGKLRRS